MIKYTYKSYGETALEVPYGWYTISELKIILDEAIKRDKKLKKMLKQSMTKQTERQAKE